MTRSRRGLVDHTVQATNGGASWRASWHGRMVRRPTPNRRRNAGRSRGRPKYHSCPRRRRRKLSGNARTPLPRDAEMLGRDDLPEELVQVGNVAAVVATTLPVGRRIARVLGGLAAGSIICPLLLCFLRLGLQRLPHPT